MVGKVPGHSGVGIVLNVKKMALEPVSEPVPSLFQNIIWFIMVFEDSF